MRSAGLAGEDQRGQARSGIVGGVVSGGQVDAATSFTRTRWPCNLSALRRVRQTRNEHDDRSANCAQEGVHVKGIAMDSWR
jgi:hypothetical protein